MAQRNLASMMGAFLTKWKVPLFFLGLVGLVVFSYLPLFAFRFPWDFEESYFLANLDRSGFFESWKFQMYAARYPLLGFLLRPVTWLYYKAFHASLAWNIAWHLLNCALLFVVCRLFGQKCKIPESFPFVSTALFATSSAYFLILRQHLAMTYYTGALIVILGSAALILREKNWGTPWRKSPRKQALIALAICLPYIFHFEAVYVATLFLLGLVERKKEKTRFLFTLGLLQFLSALIEVLLFDARFSFFATVPGNYSPATYDNWKLIQENPADYFFDVLKISFDSVTWGAIYKQFAFGTRAGGGLIAFLGLLFATFWIMFVIQQLINREGRRPQLAFLFLGIIYFANIALFRNSLNGYPTGYHLSNIRYFYLGVIPIILSIGVTLSLAFSTSKRRGTLLLLYFTGILIALNVRHTREQLARIHQTKWDRPSFQEFIPGSFR